MSKNRTFKELIAAAFDDALFWANAPAGINKCDGVLVLGELHRYHPTFSHANDTSEILLEIAEKTAIPARIAFNHGIHSDDSRVLIKYLLEYHNQTRK